MKKPNIKCLKSIKKIYGFNLSNIDITDVSLSDCDLRKFKLRKDRNLFQKIKEQNLSGTMLPERDYSRYNFKGVLIKRTIFTTKSRLPKNRNFFQKIKKKDISYATMPCMDYSIYNLKGVFLKGTIFPNNCTLTHDYSFFQKIKYKDFTNTGLPLSVTENLHLYDLNNTNYNLNPYELSPIQMFIIYKKKGN